MPCFASISRPRAGAVADDTLARDREMSTTRADLDPLGSAWLPAKVIRGLQRHLSWMVGEGLYLSTPRSNARQSEVPRFVLRVDDFPRWDVPTTEFLRFHREFERRSIPYVLGVTPFLCFDGATPTPPSEADRALLRELVGQRVELGVHGFTHLFRLAPYGQPCETYFYDDATLLDWIRRAFAWFADAGLPRPTHYIPPFNTLDARDHGLLSRHFGVMHGGPLSLSTLGKFAPSERPGAKYWPSYEPFYGRAGRLARLAHAGRLPTVGRQVLTLHWAWERQNGYRDLGGLLDWLVAAQCIDPPEALA